MLLVISAQLYRAVWYIEFSMEQDVFGENEAATSVAVDSEAPWDTAETSLHIMESEGERRRCPGGYVWKVSD